MTRAVHDLERQSQALKSIFAARRLVQDNIQVVEKPSPPDGPVNNTGMETHLAKKLGVPQPDVSGWIHGEDHMPVKYLSAFCREMSLNASEKEALYRAVIIPPGPTLSKIFSDAHMRDFKAHQILQQVRNCCCVSPQDRILTWENVVTEHTVNEWPAYRPLTNDILQSHLKDQPIMVASILSGHDKSHADALRLLDVITPVSREQKMAFALAFAVPGKDMRKPNFGPLTSYEGTGPIVRNVMITHVADKKGAIHTWQSLIDKAQAANDPHLVVDVQPVTYELVANKINERLKERGSEISITPQQAKFFVVTRGTKMTGEVLGAFCDVFNLSPAQKLLYEGAPQGPASDNKARGAAA